MLFLFLTLCGLGEFSYAAENTASRSLPFRVLDDTNTNHIGAQRAAVQDHMGFMWFGGDNGLVRYDGYSGRLFRYDSEEPNSISANLIYDLLVDDQGNLWIATVSGLNRFDPKTEVFVRYFHDPSNTNSLPSNDVRTILQDSLGRMWFGTALGLVSFDLTTGQFSRFEPLAGGPNSSDLADIWTLTEDQHQQIWVGSRLSGLFVVDTKSGETTHYRHDPTDPTSLSHVSVEVTYLDKLGKLWVGTRGGGLNKYDAAKRTFVHYRHDKNNENSIGSDFIRGIFEDSSNNFWIATDGGGLSKLDRTTGKFVSYTNQPGVFDSLKSDKIRSIYEDATGNLWFGHFPFGMSILDINATVFRNYRYNYLNPNSLSNSSILSITEDESNQLWVGTEEGLNRINLATNGVTRYLNDPNDANTLSANPALSLHKNSKGLWVGTWSGGLNMLDIETGHFKHYQFDVNDPTSISGDYIWVIYEDSHNNLWLGSETAGLNRYDPKNDNFVRYPTGTKFRSERGSNWVTAILEDSQGQFWIGTDDGLGLMDRSSGDIQYFVEDINDPHSITGNRISAILEDSSGSLWVATHGAGVNKKEQKGHNFTNYNVNDGLADNVVSGILQDQDGSLWFATSHGLSKFDPKKEVFNNYYKSDGLAGEVFNRPAYLKTSSDKLAFGSTDGLTIFSPQNQVQEVTPSVLAFTDFRILNKTVEIGVNSHLTTALNFTEEIVLDHADLVFSLEFAALNYQANDKNLYSYKLEGFDDNWSPPSLNRVATYTNLDAGEYIFTVKSLNNQAGGGERVRSMRIIVQPPPWRSWFAYTAYALIVLLIIGILSYQQLLKSRGQQRLQLALWGSGDEFWDVDLARSTVVRKNMIEEVDYSAPERWHVQSSNYIHPDDRAEISRKLALYYKGEEPVFEISYRAKTKKGGWIWLQDRGKATKYDSKGVPVRLSGTTKNIDRLKAVEEELIELNLKLETRVEQRTSELKHTAEELDRSNKYLKSAQKQIVESEKMVSLGNIVVGISHELNTPLGNAITSLTVLESRLSTLYKKVDNGTISKGVFNRFKGDATECVELVLDSLNRTTRIVDTFKLIAANRTDDQLNQKPLKALLSEAVVNVQVNSAFNAESLTIDCPDKLQLTTYNSIFIEVVMQLVENSISHAFTQSNDIVIYIEAKQQADTIKIIYQDFGKGMDKQTVNHVFDPFYTTNRGVNIGLGMHIVYNQVTHLLKGTIKCESSLDKGTRFSIELPHSL